MCYEPYSRLWLNTDITVDEMAMLAEESMPLSKSGIDPRMPGFGHDLAVLYANAEMALGDQHIVILGEEEEDTERAVEDPGMGGVLLQMSPYNEIIAIESGALTHEAVFVAGSSREGPELRVEAGQVKTLLPETAGEGPLTRTKGTFIHRGAHGIFVKETKDKDMDETRKAVGKPLRAGGGTVLNSFGVLNPPPEDGKWERYAKRLEAELKEEQGFRREGESSLEAGWVKLRKDSAALRAILLHNQGEVHDANAIVAMAKRRDAEKGEDLHREAARLANIELHTIPPSCLVQAVVRWLFLVLRGGDHSPPTPTNDYEPRIQPEQLIAACLLYDDRVPRTSVEDTMAAVGGGKEGLTQEMLYLWTVLMFGASPEDEFLSGTSMFGLAATQVPEQAPRL